MLVFYELKQVSFLDNFDKIPLIKNEKRNLKNYLKVNYFRINFEYNEHYFQKFGYCQSYL